MSCISQPSASSSAPSRSASSKSRPATALNGASPASLTPPPRRLHGVVRVTERPSVMAAEKEDEDRLAPIGVEHLAKRDDVADRLRHLLLGELKHSVVRPVAGEGPARSARLGQLVLVVGKAQVEPPAVDLELGPQVLLRHGRALDVPAWAARPPGRVPLGVLVGLRRLPERKVAWIFLPVARLLGDHLVRLGAGELAVGGIRGHAAVDVAARLVREAAVDQIADERDYLGDDLGGARLAIRPAEAPVGR